MIDEKQRWIEFGKFLSEKRKAIGKSQAKAAADAGLHRSHWGKLEIGTSGTKYETIPSIAEALRLDPAIVYEAAGFKPPESLPQTPANKDEIDVSAIYAGLQDHDQTEIRELLTLKWNRSHPGVETPFLVSVGSVVSREEREPFDFVAINLNTGVILTGVEPPLSWENAHYTPMLLRELLSKLTFLDANEKSEVEFGEMMRRFARQVPVSGSPNRL